MNLKSIPDQDLLAKTKSLVQAEREILTEVLQHLREIQRRRLYTDLGLPSLFAYCTQVLKYSESQTQRRIVAMRMIIEIPEVEEKVSSGELNLTNVARAQSFFNQEEKSAPLSSAEKLKILDELKHKSSREGEKILLSKATTKAKAVVEKFRQVTPEITEIKFAADEKLMEKINKVKGLMAHRNPKLNMAEFIDEICEIALAKLDPTRQKLKPAKGNMPKNIPPAPKVRKYISMKLKSDIWKKANGKCENCKSEFALEIDHRKPISLGGPSTLENLRLLCRTCNQRAAITKLGINQMQRYLG